VGKGTSGSEAPATARHTKRIGASTWRPHANKPSQEVNGQGFPQSERADNGNEVVGGVMLFVYTGICGCHESPEWSQACDETT
jgi:hypothetical protein